jgi:hypothetical protein
MKKVIYILLVLCLIIGTYSCTENHENKTITKPVMSKMMFDSTTVDTTEIESVDIGEVNGDEPHLDCPDSVSEYLYENYVYDRWGIDAEFCNAFIADSQSVDGYQPYFVMIGISNDGENNSISIAIELDVDGSDYMMNGNGTTHTCKSTSGCSCCDFLKNFLGVIQGCECTSNDGTCDHTKTKTNGANFWDITKMVAAAMIAGLIEKWFD